MAPKTSKARAAAQSRSAIPPQASTSTNTEEDESIYICTCSKYCGVFGVEVPQQTYSRHQRIEKGLEPPKKKPRRKSPRRAASTQSRSARARHEESVSELEDMPFDHRDNEDPVSPDTNNSTANSPGRFIDNLRNASLDDNTERLDPELIERLRNPPRGVPELDADERLALDIFLSIANASVETYNSIRSAILRRYPESALMSYHQRHTEEVLAELEDSGGIKTSPYTNFFDGSDYLDAVDEGKILEHDIVLFTSIDGSTLPEQNF
ncbi:hypothetical protein R3P38DRAFT_2813734 [Favolaschia claudopus]|uniref:Uncharacterized protein n=1 Tax=Favolaschia claudopus TaxID=2862362 RepID=A0AAV9Z4E8_9AGAR